MYLEEYENKNGFVTVFDDDGLVTIQMAEKNVKKIVSVFDEYINDNTDHTETIEVTEFSETFPLIFKLKIEGENDFRLTATSPSTNLYHDFELESCDLETWNEIKKLL